MISKLCHYIHRVSEVLAFIGALLIFLLVLLTCEQVLARYAFHSSSIAMQELQWHLFAASFLLASPYAYYKNKHISVDILSQSWSPMFRKVVTILALVIFFFPSMGFLIYYGIEFTIQARSYSTPQDFGWFQFLLQGEGSPNPGGLPGRWIIKAFIPLSALWLTMEGIAHIFEYNDRVET